jgi:O-antigen ligase
VGGLSPASVAVVSFILVRYGIQGTFNFRYPWRAVVFVAALIAGLFSGFRATLILAGLLFIIQFIAEGLYKTKYLLIFTIALGLVAILVLPVANRLPLSVQRCLTLLPLDLDRAAIEAARGSTDWRIEMWRSVIPDIPMYFWLGKGFAIDPKDIYFAQTHISLRWIAPYEHSLVAGDYHNGPLTLIIPFGIWGVLAFIWFCIAAIRVLWRNFKHGDPEIQNINTFLLVAFMAQLVYYLFLFGAFYMDMAKFAGIVGLSIAMNHGVASAAGAPARVTPFRKPEDGSEPEMAGDLQPA